MGEGTEKGILKLSGAMGLAALGCALLFGLRAAMTGKASYSYLIWNLALAFVPYAIAALGLRLLARARARRARTAAAFATSLLWLVFYPNAPYILTDFMHVINRAGLRPDSPLWMGANSLLWFDLLMNAAFAFTGHLIGLVSMWLARSLAAEAWGARAGRVLVGSAVLFSGFAVYLGRFARLNSWDLLFDPGRVAGGAAEVGSEPRAILFSAAFSLFILLSYVALDAFKRAEPIEIRPLRRD
jgi:uncharacterized membrane protein